jgi:hypothetical protein
LQILRVEFACLLDEASVLPSARFWRRCVEVAPRLAGVWTTFANDPERPAEQTLHVQVAARVPLSTVKNGLWSRVNLTRRFEHDHADKPRPNKGLRLDRLAPLPARTTPALRETIAEVKV